jgi:hypothetical protein
MEHCGAMSLTSAAVSSWVSTRGRPLAFFPRGSSLFALALDLFLEGAAPSLSELPIVVPLTSVFTIAKFLTPEAAATVVSCQMA